MGSGRPAGGAHLAWEPRETLLRRAFPALMRDWMLGPIRVESSRRMLWILARWAVVMG